MKTLQVTAENFGTIRETLKSNESCKVNNIITLVSYIADAEKINENGKKTRSAFLYISENGNRYNSTQLKNILGIEHERKGERKETTFAAIWEQAKGLAKNASVEELKEAAKYLQNLAKEKEAEAKKQEAEEIKQLEARLKELKQRNKSK